MDVRQAAAIAEQYREEGYAVVKGFVSGDELNALRQETDRIYREGVTHHATYRDGNLAFEILPERHFGQRYLIQAYWMAWISPFFEAFRRSDRFRLLLEPLLGADIKQLAQQLHWKPPGASKTGYRYHQDMKFRPQRGDYLELSTNSVNAGIAVDAATVENGCLSVFPGSHKLGYLGLSDSTLGGQIMNGLTPDAELRAAGLDPDSRVDLEMEPGDLALWGLMTVHGSLPNTSDRDRAFQISSYMRAAATPKRGEWAFRGGESIPLGPTPTLCKDDELLTRTGPVYEESEWYLAS